ncbi:MAG: ANTAR domain-containing protein [Clostridiaceae bacterium]|nr:ANTAR domain-containing protein [Clostridiaceae bacterium]MDD6702725.1 ANTAR domain-containing protein [Clostridiaceae bacterium]MDD7614374.1 ANTAR domain-containing protein [Clostridiaceae bacterium]MDY5889087.1 ANTAR domain-containing protein [Oscillospiraceae bacterium]
MTEHIYSVLVVSSAEKFVKPMLEMLPEKMFDPIMTATDATQARRKLLENDFDIVIVNSPLKDEFGTRLALDICSKSSAGVLLFVKAEHYADITAKVMPYGVLTISKPTSSSMIAQSVQMLCSTRERLRIMEKKNASVEEKIEEIRIVNRAKCLLIEQLKMTESEAHRYIEKQAMDRCVTRRVIAENIILTYK